MHKRCDACGKALVRDISGSRIRISIEHEVKRGQLKQGEAPDLLYRWEQIMPGFYLCASCGMQIANSMAKNLRCGKEGGA